MSPQSRRELRSEIIRLAQAGIPPLGISEKLGIGADVISDKIRYARKCRIEIPIFSRGKSSKFREEIIRLAQSGIPPLEISEKLGIGADFVADKIEYARKRGIEIPIFSRGRPRRNLKAEGYPQHHGKDSEIYRLAKSGMRPTEISKHLVVARGLVEGHLQYLRKIGFDVPKFLPGVMPHRNISACAGVKA
jgi:hypothetical protein